MKINFGAKFCLFVIGSLCLFVAVKDYAGSSPAAKLTSFPKPGGQYTIGQLYALMTAGGNTSINFFVPAKGGSENTLVPIVHNANPQTWLANLSGLSAHIYANDPRIGCSPQLPNWSTIENEIVTVQADPVFISYLQGIIHLTPGTLATNYQAILLYFLFPVKPAAGQPQYRLYLNEVFPGVVVQGRPSPAQSYISQWQTIFPTLFPAG
jgi:hypothetical protein